MDFKRREQTPRLKEKRPKLDITAKDDAGTPVRTKPKISLSNDSEDVRKVSVAVRIRPFNDHEASVDSICPFIINSNEIMVNNGSTTEMSSLSSTFSYDNIFWSMNDSKYEHCDQQKVFSDLALPLLSGALEGYNMCLFAYGQTGSGKSYSMMGHNNSLVGDGAGIIPRCCDQLLKQINDKHHSDAFFLTMSYFEIYNEKIHDLLYSSATNDSKVSLKVREHPTEGPYVEGLSKHKMESMNDVCNILSLGNSRRATSSTVHNNHSSRSHTIFEINIKSTINDKSVNSKVSLVDLAGSERVSQHSITGDHFKEGLSINKSLLTLGKVITALSEKNGFVPYRESVLTWLLKECLGGNSKTVMLATISPSCLSLEESLSTLRYACQARHILNKVVVNEDPQLKLIRELKAEVDRLKSLHDYKKNEQTKMDNCNYKGILTQTSDYVKYENELLNIEKAQKIVEEKLQAELSRIGFNLQAAERRRDELESQKSLFLEKIQKNDVSQYKSDFYQNLQEILNNSTPSASVHSNCSSADSDVVDNLTSLKTSLDNLKAICSSDKENSSQLKQIEPLVEYIDKCYHDICEILELN